ncbi:MAG: ThuA domain-containing protein [Saprospiraceae bacterium]|nr:ThuA domain-containing protein [Saprospiraceae bacterium]
MRPTYLLLLLLSIPIVLPAQSPLRILNFQGDNGFQHDSKDEALQMIKLLGIKNDWEVRTTADIGVFTDDQLKDFDVLVFNNNCGTDGPIFTAGAAQALQTYIRKGGGFVGIHCAGAIWKEEEGFQEWYAKLIGTTLIAHPEVQPATLDVENSSHPATAHLPSRWEMKDEWHIFSSNPRPKVNVLISLDESTYNAEDGLKMGGDHPFTWYHYYDGGRSFFTSLGHAEETYQDANFQKMIQAAILWAGGHSAEPRSFPDYGLLLDLDADQGVKVVEGNRVTRWTNQVPGAAARDFIPHDYGLRLRKPGSGRPLLKRACTDLNGHNAISFQEDELINDEEDALDFLLTGSGYTWLTVIKPYATADPDGSTEFGVYRLKDVNSFMGNLRNGGRYEGLWGCFDDDLTVWCGSRSGVSFGRFDENNPKLSGPKLEPDQFYLIAARMGAGVGTVNIELFVNTPDAVASTSYPVSEASNPSKLAIGTERDATNHPGSESFDGEIARFLIYERPLSDQELGQAMQYLRQTYGLK